MEMEAPTLRLFPSFASRSPARRTLSFLSPPRLFPLFPTTTCHPISSSHLRLRLLSVSASSCTRHPDACQRFLFPTRRPPLLLYPALLLGGIALIVTTPAVACPASPPVHEVVVDKDAEKRREEVEPVKDESKNAVGEESSQCELTHRLGDEFWNEISAGRGSTERMLKSILDRDPLNVSALECLAKRLLEVDDSAHALTVLEKLEALQPNEIEWKLLKSEAYDLDGQFQRAKQGFQDILKVEPFSSKALQGLIMAMDQLNESDEALKIAVDTMVKAKLENNTKEARNIGILIGQIHTLKGRFEEALKHFKLLVEEDVNDFRPYLCQGIIYSILGEKEMAEEHFKNYKELCPKELPGRSFLDGLMSRARREGEKAHDHKQMQELQLHTNLKQ